MDLELLVVGIARGSEDDFNSFYEKTKDGAFAFALVLTGDRILAREAAAESYRRVVSEAKVFDTSMSAKLWHLEMVRNLCMNGMADGEIAKQAESARRENLSRILTAALYETAEDRGKIIGVRLGVDLSMAETARLLWYNPVSCKGEYNRGIREAAAVCGYKGEDKKSFRELEDIIREDFKQAVPDYLELAKGGRETAFSNINSEMLLAGESDKALPGESREDRQKRMAEKTVSAKRRKVIATVVAVAVLLAAAAVLLTVYFLNNRQSRTGNPDDEDPGIVVEEPQYRTQAECAVLGNKIFYSNYADNGALYVYDISTGKASKVSDVVPRDFSDFSGNICYFRNASAGEICSIDAETLEVRTLEAEFTLKSTDGDGNETFETYTAKVQGALPTVSGNDLFFSSKNGVSKYSGGKVTEIFTDNTGNVLRCCMAVIGDSVVFSSGPSTGFNRLILNDAGDYFLYGILDSYVIYDFCVAGTKIAFDDGDGALYLIDLESGKLLPAVKGVLLSGAFCIDHDTIYFYGVDLNLKRGIYSVTVEDVQNEKDPVLVMALDGRDDDVSDIYVSGDTLLLYYSNGEKKGAYNELVLIKAGGAAETIFKNKGK